ncbi:MAG: hypothetical protein WAO00_18860 [Chthoniobacterales bacterium]
MAFDQRKLSVVSNPKSATVSSAELNSITSYKHGANEWIGLLGVLGSRLMHFGDRELHKTAFTYV